MKKQLSQTIRKMVGLKSTILRFFMVFQGGILFSFGKYLTDLLSGTWDLFTTMVRNKIMTTLEIISSDDRDDLFHPMFEWLSKQSGIQNTNNLQLLTKECAINDYFTKAENSGHEIHSEKKVSRYNNSYLERYTFTLSEGKHQFHYRNKKIHVEYELFLDEVPDESTHYFVPIKDDYQVYKLTLTAYGDQKKLFQEIIKEALELKREMGKKSSNIYLMNKFADAWKRDVSEAKSIKMGFVILKKGLAEHLVNDCRQFLGRRQIYTRLGIPFKRCVLFYGDPGCGKTTTVRALAGELGLPICIMSLSNKELNDDRLLTLMNKAPRPCVVLLEDVDSCFVQREASDKKDHNRVSFSGLLNCLDGVGAQEGRLFFMTTNHIERLSPALIRPGRVDKKVKFQKADKHQAEGIFLKFFEGHPKLAKQFADKVPEDRMSMALIQQHLLNYFDEPEKCLQKIDELIRECEKSEEFQRLEKKKYKLKQKEIEKVKSREKEKLDTLDGETKIIDVEIQNEIESNNVIKKRRITNPKQMIDLK
ncbi:atpase [Anaeramoeba flamelloides]|uniref:Atpase n=1 Tax=Anaeramoeba flamelloides TaxID=1746091 RepID=A0ABQ8XI11_9EUKA|nr:atpase [Anaeramoeba flamelloides]